MLEYLFNKVARLQPCNFIKKRLQAFSYEICEIFKNTYFEEHLGTTASAKQVLFNDFHQKCITKLQHFSMYLLRSLLCSHKTRCLRLLRLAMGVPYLAKLQVTFYVKKLNFIHQGFLPQFKKSFIPEKPFVKHTFAQCFSMAAH